MRVVFILILLIMSPSVAQTLLRWYSQRRVSTFFRKLAHQWSGSLENTTMFTPPSLIFTYKGREGELRAFSLTEYGREYNYTRLNLKLRTPYLLAFEMTLSETGDTIPEYCSSEIELIKSVTGTAKVNLRCDGNQVTVSIRDLILDCDRITAVRKSLEIIVDTIEQHFKDEAFGHDAWKETSQGSA